MRYIKSFNDIILIINQKLDVVDEHGHKIPFVRFVSLSLVEIVNILNSGDWEYQPND